MWDLKPVTIVMYGGLHQVCGRGPYSRGSGGRSPPEAKFSLQFTEGIAVVSQQSQGKNQKFPGSFMKSFRHPDWCRPPPPRPQFPSNSVYFFYLCFNITNSVGIKTNCAQPHGHTEAPLRC